MIGQKSLKLTEWLFLLCNHFNIYRNFLSNPNQKSYILFNCICFLRYITGSWISLPQICTTRSSRGGCIWNKYTKHSEWWHVQVPCFSSEFAADHLNPNLNVHLPPSKGLVIFTQVGTCWYCAIQVSSMTENDIGVYPSLRCRSLVWTL